MNIRNTQELRAFAAQRVAVSPSQKQILLIYAGIVLGLAALVPLINYIIGLQIDQYSGLRHMGRRSVLSSIQLFLPFGVNLITMCLDLGYLAAMLRIARGPVYLTADPAAGLRPLLGAAAQPHSESPDLFWRIDGQHLSGRSAVYVLPLF